MLHKLQVWRWPRYQKNFTWQNFSHDRSKLPSKGCFAKDLAKLVLSSSAMYLKKLQETSGYRVCRVLACSRNVIALPNWPHFVSVLPVYNTKDTQNLHVTTELQYGSLFRWKFLTNNRTCKQNLKSCCFNWGFWKCLGELDQDIELWSNMQKIRMARLQNLSMKHVAKLFLSPRRSQSIKHWSFLFLLKKRLCRF